MCDGVPSVDFFGIGCNISDSKMRPSFHIASLLCRCGIMGLSSHLCEDCIIHKMILWYMNFILFFALVFVLCQIFCRNGGGVMLRLCNQGKVFSHLDVLVGGSGIWS